MKFLLARFNFVIASVVFLASCSSCSKENKIEPIPKDMKRIVEMDISNLSKTLTDLTYTSRRNIKEVNGYIEEEEFTLNIEKYAKEQKK